MFPNVHKCLFIMSVILKRETRLNETSSKSKHEQSTLLNKVGDGKKKQYTNNNNKNKFFLKKKSIKMSHEKCEPIVKYKNMCRRHSNCVCEIFAYRKKSTFMKFETIFFCCSVSCYY